jgi:two-component system CheB/CheR fusion protein
LHENIKDKIEGKDSNYLEKIIRSANRMQVLIQDILTSQNYPTAISRIPPLTSKTSLPTSLMTSMYLIKEKNVQVKTENLPVIQAIPGQIHQLFQNLLSNSIKFNKVMRH